MRDGLQGGDSAFKRFEAFTKLSDLHNQVRQSAQCRLFTEGLAVGDGRNAADDSLGGDIIGDAAAGGGHRAVANGCMISHGGLSAQYNTRAKDG